MYRSVMRVMLSGAVAMVPQSATVRSFWALLLSLCWVLSGREYSAFAKASNDALATMAQYQIFFTSLLAFLLLDEPFNVDYEAVAWLLVFATVAVLLFALRRSVREAQARLDLRALNEEVALLADELENFKGSVLNIVAVNKPMTFKVRTKFLPGGEWCASASREELLEAYV